MPPLTVDSLCSDCCGLALLKLLQPLPQVKLSLLAAAAIAFVFLMVVVMKREFIAEHATVCSKQQGALLLVKQKAAAAMMICQACLSCTVVLPCLAQSHTSAGNGRCSSTTQKVQKSNFL